MPYQEEVYSLCTKSVNSAKDLTLVDTPMGMEFEQVDAVNATPLGNSYNPNWRNHPGFSWRNNSGTANFQKGHHSRFFIRGTSMLPCLHPGIILFMWIPCKNLEI